MFTHGPIGVKQNGQVQGAPAKCAIATAPAALPAALGVAAMAAGMAVSSALSQPQFKYVDAA